MRIFLGLVGVAMFAGFGWIAVDLALDLRAYPKTPREMRVSDAAAQQNPGRAPWVKLTDVKLPCAWRESSPSSYIYRMATGPSGSERIVIAKERELPCSDTPVALVGVLRSTSPGRIVDLEFREMPWEKWPTPYQITLWIDSGPADARAGLIFMPPLALLGLFIALSYFRGAPSTEARPVPKRMVSVENAHILPRRPLELSEHSGGGVLIGVGFLLSAGAMMAGIPLSYALTDDEPLGLGRVLLFGFFFLLAAFLFYLAFALVRARFREKRLGGNLREHVVPLLGVEPVLANGVDVGNRKYLYTHPLRGKRAEYVAAPPDAPLVLESHLLLVGSDAHLVVVRENFEPFVLSDEERAQAMDTLRKKIPTS